MLDGHVQIFGQLADYEQIDALKTAGKPAGFSAAAPMRSFQALFESTL